MTTGTPHSYDLRTEPWICCEHRDARPELLGIEATLVRAHELAAVHDESPLVTAMVHRLLLAILHRIYAPRSMEDWLAIWEADAFDETRIRSYLDAWGHRFDLFHPERPFLQVARLAEVLRAERGKDPEPIEARRMAIECSVHSNATQLFERLPPNPHLPAAMAAGALLGYLGYTPGGRIQNESASWGAGNMRAGAAVLIRGDSLKQTLLLNLLWRRERHPEDVPPWEREVPTQRARRPPRGLVDQLMWLSRRVQLIPARSEDGRLVAREVITAAGEQDDSDRPEPMFAYVVRDPKKPPMATRIDRDRAMWRDAAALFDMASGGRVHRRPLACSQLAELVLEGALPRHTLFRLELFGLSSNQAAIRLWRAERMPLPPALLVDGERLTILRSALELTEELGAAINLRVLRVLAEHVLAPGDRKPHANDVDDLRQALGTMPAFWSELGQRFPTWLGALGTATELDPLLVTWKATLRSTAKMVVGQAERRLGATARALQAGARARRELARALFRVLGNPDPSQDESQGASA